MVLLMASGAMALAQNNDDLDPCYETEIRSQTIVNPMTGQPVTINQEVDVYNEACDGIRDERVNSGPNERAAEAAIYCKGYGVDIYDIGWSGEGELVLRATWAEIDAVPNPPATNTLIDGVPGFALYRLTTGELQLNGPANWEGKPYVFIWDGCSR